MFDLATAKVRLGTTTLGDLDIQRALDQSLAYAEAVMDRKLTKQAMTEYFYPDKAVHTLSLSAYPVDRTVQIKVNDQPFKGKIDAQRGLIHFEGLHYSHEIKVEYTGGFNPFPADMEGALWSVFDSVAGAMAGGGSVSGGGDIESISIPDVGTIRFSQGDSGSGGAAGGAGGIDPLGAYFPFLTAIADRYRRVSC